MSLPQLGEQLVGAYYQLIEECELVSYNVNAGRQNEMDILGLKSIAGEKIVYLCEVATHLDGLDYSRKASADDWDHIEGVRAQGNLEKIHNKFSSNYKYALDRFENINEIQLHFWSPYVKEGGNTEGLDQIASQFSEDDRVEMELFINERYTRKIGELRSEAGNETTQRGIPAYRVLQILEHMR